MIKAAWDVAKRSLVNTCEQVSFFQHELANECAKCERYIGTQGGGMDQSISFLAEKGTVGFALRNIFSLAKLDLILLTIDNPCA